MTFVGCVIPLAPEFENPEKNQPPFIVSANPSVGSEIGPSTEEQDEEFEVTLRDPNPGDELYVRWIFNYPPYSDDNTRISNVNRLPPTSPDGPRRIAIAVNCSLLSLPKGRKQHRVMLAVSDRQFKRDVDSAPDLRLTGTQPDAHLLQAVWTLNKECK